jgi:hypothetical protein
LLSSQRIKQIALGVVGVCCLELVRLLSSKVFDALIRLIVPLDIEALVLLVDPYKSVTAITIYVTVSVRSASITKQNGNLMHAFRSQTQKVPKHVGVL